MALAALVLLSACNDSENRPVYTVFGSQENGKTLILPTGGVANPVTGGEIIPSLPTGMERVRVQMAFYVQNDLPVDQWWGTPQTPVNIELADFRQFPKTRDYSLTGTAEADDPILFPYPLADFDYAVGLTGQTPGISCSMNYLDMRIIHFPYMKDAVTAVEVTPVLEVDENLVPGPEADTVYMALKFDSNRGNNDFEDMQLAELHDETTSFDLQRVPVDFGFPTTDHTGAPKTYIIKMSYKSFANPNLPKEDEEIIRYVTVEWTPDEPYISESE